MIARSLARSAYLAAARVLRFEERLLDGIRRSRHVVVLNLHSVSPAHNDYYPPLHPDHLDLLVRFLRERITLTTFGELAEVPADEPAAILSFDDGFHDFVEYAMPVLARHGVRVGQNVVVSSVLTGVPPWTQRLNDLIAAAPSSLLREIRLPGLRIPSPDDDQRSRARYGAALGAYLVQYDHAARVPLLEALDACLGRTDVRPTRMMDARDVREAAASHEIGAHSFAHDPMGVEAIDHFRDDVERCDAFFRDTLGRPFDVYAFPNGSHRPEQVELLERRGSKAILLVGDRYAARGPTVFPRFNLGAREPALLRLEALGFRARPLPL